MAEAQGVQEIKDLTDNGFSGEEIESWRQQTVNELHEGGFSQTEIGEYFGEKNPDMASTKAYLDKNIAKNLGGGPKQVDTPALETLPGAPPTPDQKPKLPGETTPSPQVSAKEAHTMLEAIEAGWDMSVTGLIKNGKLPDTILPEHAPMYMRIASQVGMLAGDAPAMAAGSVAGGVAGASIGGLSMAAAGSVIPVAGTLTGAAVGVAGGGAAGASAGAFALPAAVRTTLMQHYQKGDVQDFGDFWERSSAVFLESLKAGTIGVATSGAGALAKGVIGGAAAPIVRNAAVAASEVAAMTTVGKAIEGHVPKAEDFVEAALVVGGLHAVVGGTAKVAEISGKMRDIYSKTGVKPEQVFEHSVQEPTIKQDLIANNTETPKAYESLVDKTAGEPGRLSAPRKTTNTLESPKAEISNVVGGTPNKLEVEPFKFDPDATVKIEPKVESGVTAPVPVEKSAYQSAQEKVLARIGTETPREKEPYTFNKFYKDFVDAKDPLNVIVKMTDKNTPLEANPYIQARLFVDHSNKSKHWFEFSPTEFDTNQPVKGVQPLMKILEPFKSASEVNAFDAYVLSKRALEIEASGRKTGVDLEAAKTVVEGGKSQYEANAKELVKYNNQLSKYMLDAGFLTKEGHKAMVEQNDAYVPMYRIVEKADGSKGQPGRGLFSPFKKLKGSEAEIVSPLESIAKNTALYVKRGEQNRAIRSFVEFAEKNDIMGGEFIKKSERSMKKIEISKDVNQFLEQNGIEGSAENVAIFRPEALKLGPNDVPVFRNGKMEVYEMHPDIAEIYRKMDGSPAAGMITKLLRPFASLQRASIALTPDFIMRNGIRDATTAAVFSKYKHVPVYDSLVAMGDIIGKSEHYQGWLRSGGGNGSFLDVDTLINKNMYRIDKETNFMSKSLNVLKSPFEMIHVVSNIMENSTRVAAYKNALKGKDLNSISLSESMNAGMQSREITVDFARMGAKGQAINQITAYWNVGVQGMDRTARAFQENPTGTAARAAAYITAPSILLWYANKDDPRWREIPRWQKDAFWIVFTKDETYRIPKPMELGLLFGSLPERTLEKYMTDNPEAMKDFDQSMLKMVEGFAPLPTGIAPVVEHWANKSTFTGNPIISSRYEGLFPEYQFTENTSETAKLVAKFVSVMPGMKERSGSSPMIIEHYARAWAGNTGMYALSALDKAMEKAGIVNPPPKPTATLSDIPFVKAFTIKYPSSNTQSIVDFEERYRKQDVAVKTIRHLAKQGDFDNMQKELQLASRNGDLEKLDKLKQGIGNMSAMVQMINRDPSMNPDEKRQSIDGLYSNMIEAAKMGREIQRSVDKDLGTE